MPDEIPDRIFLQVECEECEGVCQVIQLRWCEVTFSKVRVYASDVEYARVKKPPDIDPLVVAFVHSTVPTNAPAT